ncbi:hypothetical protein M407DRAFT_76403 [Tulasnella calospora MUT 4182]|uniref:Ribosomal protein/NADH dehydrogenase domain-containing protein n=1 Tax=Tulasnella calospora MUT 4182 TaxID=1051891 RepID=A0A0C3Q6D0_9AGAM|nr:hypothetical protein M407DRAFT_76403 [Tulasnella calospora MUT 4182]
MPGPVPAKPTSLAKALSHLTKQPQPKVSAKLRALSVTFAKRNAHYGARHFVKDDLPRVAYSNPNLKISVERRDHLRESPWAPELRAEFADGTKSTIDMTQKHSSAILQELLNLGTETAPKASPAA